ncbi:MAG: hypothetical protein GY747_04830 [Planctomycetes bacterium]|nr:hypothetical protein [Planctomycetota bacterium]MCP4860733.1 hypothetical protein [Planctomycetota bacterium]
MNTPPSTPDSDALLAHSGWVRALARNLVVDPSAADDVEQQAWLTAMERPPTHGGNLRSWWGSWCRLPLPNGGARLRVGKKPPAAAVLRIASPVSQNPTPWPSASILSVA